MKKLNLIMIFLAPFLFSKAQSFEVEGGRDTLNLINADGKKQGQWIIKGMNRPGSCYQPYQKIEEGKYKDNKRIGVWKEYHCNSNIKSKITYIDGRPNGPAAFYYTNGSVKEQGTWTNNRWVGKYISIDDKGNTTEIVFDEKGKEKSKKIMPPSAKK